MKMKIVGNNPTIFQSKCWFFSSYV